MNIDKTFREQRKKAKPLKVVIFSITLFSLFLFFSLTLISAEEWGYNFLDAGENLNPSTGGGTTLSGNLTNLSQLADTNVPSPNNNDVLTWDSTQNNWTAQVGAGGGDNSSWNQSFAETLFIGSGNTTVLSTFNQTYDNFVTNNISNKTFFWDNLDTFNATQMENNGGTLNILQSWFTTLWDAIFATKTTDDLTEGTTNFYDNVTWNQSLEPNFNVNSTLWWAGLTGFSSPWFFNSANDLELNETNLNDTLHDFGFNETDRLTEFYDLRYLTGELALYFHNTSDFHNSSYTIMNTTIPTGLEQRDSFENLVNGDNLLTKRILSTLNITILERGAYNQHTTIDYISGNKDISMRSELYILYDNGTETLIGQSPPSIGLIIGIYQQIIWTGIINDDIIFPEGSHLTMYLYATVVGSGQAPDIDLVVGADTSARLDIGINPTDIKTIEVDPFAIYKDGTTTWGGNEDGGGFNSTNWNIGFFTELGSIISRINNGYFQNLSVNDTLTVNKILIEDQSNITHPTTNLNVSKLIGWWRLDDNVSIADSSGNDNHGIANNNPKLTTDAIINKAFILDRFDADYINVSDSDSLDFVAGQDFAISVWAKPRPTNSLMMLVSKKPSTGYNFFVTPEGSLQTSINDGTNTATNCIGTINGTDDDEWHHYLASYDRDADVTLYIDGVLCATMDITASDGDLSNTQELLIGSSFNGSIDDVIIFNTTLNSSDVSTIFDNKMFPSKFVTTSILHQVEYVYAKQISVENIDAGSVHSGNFTGSGDYINVKIQDLRVTGTLTTDTTCGITGGMIISERATVTGSASLSLGNGDLTDGAPMGCSGVVEAITGVCENCDTVTNHVALELYENGVAQDCDTIEMTSSDAPVTTDCAITFIANSELACFHKTETGAVTGTRCTLYVRFT